MSRISSPSILFFCSNRVRNCSGRRNIFHNYICSHFGGFDCLLLIQTNAFNALGGTLHTCDSAIQSALLINDMLSGNTCRHANNVLPEIIFRDLNRRGRLGPATKSKPVRR
jgi:hypothetical protein